MINLGMGVPKITKKWGWGSPFCGGPHFYLTPVLTLRNKYMYRTCWGENIHIRGKAFREMKKDVGMTTAQKNKETRRMEMGSIFVLYIQPTIPT